MKKDPMPLGLAVFVLIIGVFLGSVFTFGTQYWNATVTRGDCVEVTTQFLDYVEIRKPNRPVEIKEIAVDCANGERYFVDGVCINSKLRSALARLSANEDISLLIHPNSSTITEFSTETGCVLEFEDTITKLSGEATGFLFLGIFMYICALVGLYYVVLHAMRKSRNKK